MGPHSDYKCANCDVVSDLVIKEAKACPACGEGPLVRLFNAINVANNGLYRFGEKLATPALEQRDKLKNSKKELEQKNEKLMEAIASQPAPVPPKDIRPRSGITGQAGLGMVDPGGRAMSQQWARSLFGRKVTHRPA